MTTELDAAIDLSADNTQLLCTGNWTMSGVVDLQSQLDVLVEKTGDTSTLDASAIDAMDSAGALLLQDLMGQFKHLGKQIRLVGVRGQYQTLLDLVADEASQVCPPPPSKSSNFLYLVGELSYKKWVIGTNLLAFVGQMVFSFLHALMNPQHIQWRLILRNIDEAGYRALPIVGLLIFLVGGVLTFEIAIELTTLNAPLYIVDVTGMVMLREFAPLITAVILAGRTCTAYSAQIGTMKLNEEVDALNTMGVSPFDRLVMPKVIGLLIAVPLLVVWADIFGVLGSMVVSKMEMGVGYYAYLTRFQQSIAVSNYVVGLVKAPVFALIIAIVGCFQGFQVSGSADDVGRKTTQSAVQSIFLIIIADAIFSVLFSWRGI